MKAPTRPLSAYLLFCQKQQKSVRKCNPELSSTAVLVTIAKQWKEASVKTKKPFVNKAAKASKVYKKKAEKYRKTASYLEDLNHKREAALLKKHAVVVGIQLKPNANSGRFPRDPSAPKHPLTAFMFFSKQQRPVVTQNDPTLSFVDTTKVVTQQWKELSAEEKAKFYKMQEGAKADYEKEVEKYKETSGAKTYASAHDDWLSDRKALKKKIAGKKKTSGKKKKAAAKKNKKVGKRTAKKVKKVVKRKKTLKK